MKRDFFNPCDDTGHYGNLGYSVVHYVFQSDTFAECLDNKKNILK